MKYIIEGVLMTTILLFGIFGNSISIYILRNEEVKLQPIFVEVLCCLSVFDNLFLLGAFLLYSLPQLFTSYAQYAFHFLAPYLYPVTNTFLTGSSYMTVVVALNRYLLGKGGSSEQQTKLNCNGYHQAGLVFLLATSVNVPRWFEFSCCKYTSYISNKTDTDFDNTSTSNITQVQMVVNPIRNSYEYIRDYTLIASNILTLFIPMLFMVIFSGLAYRDMQKSPVIVNRDKYGCDELKEENRSRSLTLIMIGIIVLFIICRIGELGISIYELNMILLEGKRSPFPQYIKNIISINSFLVVCNSSLNFIIYYNDVLFRKCFLKCYQIFRENLVSKQRRTVSVNSSDQLT